MSAAFKRYLGNSVTVAQLTLDQLVKVRILVPQVVLFIDGFGIKEKEEYEVSYHHISGRGRGVYR